MSLVCFVVATFLAGLDAFGVPSVFGVGTQSAALAFVALGLALGAAPNVVRVVRK